MTRIQVGGELDGISCPMDGEAKKVPSPSWQNSQLLPMEAPMHEIIAREN